MLCEPNECPTNSARGGLAFTTYKPIPGSNPITKLTDIIDTPKVSRLCSPNYRGGSGKTAQAKRPIDSAN